MLEFVLELNQKYNLKNVKLANKAENKKLEREKRKLENKNGLRENFFNVYSNMITENSSRKVFKEDQENIIQKNMINQIPTAGFKSHNKTITEFFKLKIPENKPKNIMDNNKIYNFPDKILENVNFFKNFIQSRGKHIEFYDELNKKNIKFSLFEEKDLKFCKSKILPQMKLMKLDNDVLTEDEQIKDASSMLKENIKETIKNINNEGKEYLQKNLSRKMNFRKK